MRSAYSKSLYILIFQILTLTAFAQTSINSPEDKAKIDGFISDAVLSEPFNDEEEGQMLYDLAKRIDYNIGEAKILQRLAQNHSRNRKDQKAIESMNQAGKIILQMGTDADKLNFLSSFASIYRLHNYHKEAMDKSEQAIDLAEKLRDSLSLAHVIWNSAKAHLNIQQRSKYFELSNRALSIYQQIGETEGIINVYMHFGNISPDQDSTFYYLNKAKSFLPQIKNSKSRQKIKINLNSILGRIYYDNEQYPQAETLLLEVVEIAKNLQNLEAIAISNYYLAGIQLYHYRNYPKAIRFIKSHLQYERSIGRYYYVVPAAQFLSEIYIANDQPKKALEYAQLAMLYQDSMYWANRKNDAAEVEKAYELEKQKSEIKLLENQHRTRSILGFTIACILLLFIGFFYRQHQLKSRFLKHEEELSQQLRQDKDIIEQQKNELENANRTKDRLMAIIGHDLRGPLFSLQGLEDQINYLLETNQQERLKELGSKMEQTTKFLTETLNNLLNWSMHQMGKFPYDPKLIGLSESVEKVFALFESAAITKGIKMTSEVPTKLYVQMDQNALSTILRNLISNALKYTQADDEIEVQGELKNGNVVLTISDTGVGMTNEQVEKLTAGVEIERQKGTGGEKSTGLGWLLIRDLIKQNKGTFEIKSKLNKGTSILVNLPVSN